jgi:hypothetical protein
MGGSPLGVNARARTINRQPNADLNAPPNVRYWAKSGHGADLSVCPLMTQSGHSTFLARLRLDLYSPGPRIDRWSSRRSSSGSRFHLLPFPGGPQRLHVMHPVRCSL